jgi:hypothetical protein
VIPSKSGIGWVEEGRASVNLESAKKKAKINERSNISKIEIPRIAVAARKSSIGVEGGPKSCKAVNLMVPWWQECLTAQFGPFLRKFSLPLSQIISDDFIGEGS